MLRKTLPLLPRGGFPWIMEPGFGFGMVAGVWPPVACDRLVNDGDNRLLTGVRRIVEEFHDARLQRILGPHDQQPVGLDQLFKNLRPVPQLLD